MIVTDSNKLETADHFMRIDFTYTRNGIVENWNYNEGENFDYENFLIIESMAKNYGARRDRVLTTLVNNPDSKVDIVITPIVTGTTTSLEYAITFKDLEEGYYDINFITNGLQEWNNNRQELFYFDQQPVGITLFNREKEDPADINAAIENAEKYETLGSTGKVVAQGATVVASVFSTSLAQPFIKFL